MFKSSSPWPFVVRAIIHICINVKPLSQKYIYLKLRRPKLLNNNNKKQRKKKLITIRRSLKSRRSKARDCHRYWGNYGCVFGCLDIFLSPTHYFFFSCRWKQALNKSKKIKLLSVLSKSSMHMVVRAR